MGIVDAIKEDIASEDPNYYWTCEYKRVHPIRISDTVLYFDAISNKFVRSLAEYLKEHPNTRVESIFPVLENNIVYAGSATNVKGHCVIVRIRELMI